jgi:hypothetical protein
MPIDDPPPIPGMIQFDLKLERLYPGSPPAYLATPIRSRVMFEIAFEDDEQAEKLEGKIRQLLQGPDMVVVSPEELAERDPL